MRDNFKTFLVLIATLFLFQTVWGQVNYGITVAGTEVTSENASNVLNDDYSSVSYDAGSNTLTLKGVHLNSTNNGISVPSDLNINLIGYSNVGTINVTSGTLNFTTSTTLPGCLITNITGNSTITYGDGTGLSWDGSMVKSSSTNPYIIYATGCKMDGDNYCISGGDFSVKDNKGEGAALDVSPDGTVAYSLNNASIDYFKVSTTSTNPTSCYIYPASLDDMNLVNKVYFLFDWGTCTNKDVKVQIKGLDSNYANDGTYSEEVSLPADGGLVEIPLTGTVNSYYFQIYFSSSTGEFSFIPISVGFLKTEGYGLTVAGVEVTADNASNITGANITAGIVSYNASTNTLTLNGATLSGSIEKTATETGEQLIINLVGKNTVNGQISFQSEDRMYLGDLSFTGSGSLNITSNDENGVIDGVSSVNTAEGLYIATDTPDPICYNGYYIAGISGSVMSLTVSTNVTYPVWVYNTSTTHYTQLTAATSTFTTPEQNADENHSGSVSFSNNTLTLTNFLCKTTENNDFVFFVGKSLQNLTVNLVGESYIHQNSFHYAQLQETEEEPTLTFTTSDNGKLTFEGEPSFWYVTVNYENGLGFYSNVISTDWPRLQIGENTFVRGTASTIGEDYANVSFDDATNTLTLNGVTIGTQNSTVTDITVYIKDLNVEISGTNTVYGRFYGLYEENGYRAGTITFKKKSGAETANLTVSGVGDDNGPVTSFASSILGEGLYISGIGDNNEPISTLSYQGGEYYGLDGNMAKTVTISENAPDTKLWIGETEVTSANAEDVFGDGKVSYNMTTQTLSLNGATIEEEIVSNVGTLTINLTGSNSVNSISATGNATALAFTGDGTLTLENSDGIISNFSSVNTGDFNLLSNSTPGIHWNATSKKFMAFDNLNIASELTLTHATVYQLWVGGVQVTEANMNGITGITIGESTSTFTSITGSVKFTPTGNILTLTDANIGSPYDNWESPIISNLPNLELNINKIDNNIAACILAGYENEFISDGGGGVKSLNADATLVFSTNYTSSSEAESPTLQIDCYAPIASGFKSISTSNQMIYKETSNYYWVQRIAQPSMSIGNGSLQLSDNNEVDLNYESNSAVTLKYKITDASGTTGEEKTFVETTVETINNPCTIEAWAEYQGQESGHIKGKYFGPAEDPMRLVYGADPVDFVLAPAIEEGDGIIINGIEANVNYSSTTGKVSSETLGSHGAIVSLGYTSETVKTLLLNNYFNMSFNVVPPTATITCDKGQNDPYLNTQVITLSQTAIDGYNTKIFYAWETGETEVNVPTDTFEQPGTEYNSETTIHPQVGKLKAWVGYHLGDNEYLNSEVTTLEITAVKTDFTDAVVSCPTSAAYTGSAINPEITVKASAQAENNLVKDEDYTVSYKKVGEGEALTDVTSMVDAGSYKIIITGAGNYVGSISKDFEIVRASVDWNATGWTSPEAKTDLTFTNEAKDLITAATVPDGVTVKYCYKYSTSEFNEEALSALPDPVNWTTTVPQGTNAGYYAVFYKVEESANYEGWGPCEVALQISIAPKVTTFTVELVNPDEAITYDGTAKTPAIIVKDGNTELTATTDYTITGYLNNINAATSNAVTPPTVNIAGAGNYNGSTGSATFTINKAQLTVTPDNKTYNVGEAITLTVQYSGFVNGEDENALLKTPIASYGDADVTKAGIYTITVSGGEAQNYDFVYGTGTLTINRELGIGFADNQTWATYYATENLTVPEGLKAYIVTDVDKVNGTVTTSQVTYLPMNQAVLLEKTGTSSSGFVAAPYTSATTTITNNLLMGSDEAVGVSSINGGTVYVLYYNVFKRATGGTIPARHAYLVVSDAAPARLNIVHGGDDTGIDNIHMDETNDNWYTIDGRKLNGEPQRAGFYIRNGKKVYKR